MLFAFDMLWPTKIGLFVGDTKVCLSIPLRSYDTIPTPDSCPITLNSAWSDGYWIITLFGWKVIFRVASKRIVNTLSGFASNERSSESLPGISFGKSGGVTTPLSQRSPSYAVFWQSHEDFCESMTIHLPPCRQGLGLQRIISRKNSNRNRNEVRYWTNRLNNKLLITNSARRDENFRKREQEFSVRFCYNMNSSFNAHSLMTTHTFTRKVSYVPCYVAGVSQPARCNVAARYNVSFYTVKCACGTKRRVTWK